jgi:periplasmic protein TonB
MVLNEDGRLFRFLVPAVAASIVVHGLALILIGMAVRMLPHVFKPQLPKIITVDLVVDRPAAVAPSPEKVLPPKVDRSTTIEPTKPEKELPVSPKRKRIVRNQTVPAVVPPPPKKSEIPNSEPPKDGMTDLQVSLSKDDGNVMPVDTSVSTGSTDGGNTIALASGPTGKDGAGSGLAVESSGGVIDAKPLYKRNPPPDYPGIARKSNMEGTVIVIAKVSRKGKVLEAKLDQSSGHALLDSAAVEAVKSWEFEPGKRGGESIESMVRLPITFELK